MAKLTKEQLKAMEGTRTVDVVGDARPLFDDSGKPVQEVYEKNKDVILKFGEKDGEVVIRSIDLPKHYDKMVVQTMIEYGQKNIGNCPICTKHERFLKSAERESLNLGIEQFGDSWVVDLDPKVPSEVHIIKPIKHTDVAMGLGVKEKGGRRNVEIKKLSFPMEKYSREEALKKAQEARTEIEARRQSMIKARSPPPPPRPPIRKEHVIHTPPEEPSQTIGIFPNVVDWRRNRIKPFQGGI